MARKYSNIESPAVGEVFIALWGTDVLLVAQPYIGCAGCIGEIDDMCCLLPLCGKTLREDGADVRYVVAEEK